MVSADERPNCASPGFFPVPCGGKLATVGKLLGTDENDLDIEKYPITSVIYTLNVVALVEFNPSGVLQSTFGEVIPPKASELLFCLR